jgi:hypothetical protein
MPATLDKPKPTHREEQPVLSCMRCGCWLRSFHPTAFCDPCGRPEWELSDQEIWEIVAKTGNRYRPMAMEAVAELLSTEP